MSDLMVERRDSLQSTNDDEEAVDPADAFHRATRLTCGLGLAFAVLFVVALLSFAQYPTLGASDAEVVAFYRDGDQRLIQLGGLYLLPLAAVAFLWFIAALREWVIFSARTTDRMMSTVQMLSGVGFITLAFAAAGAATIVSLSSDPSSLAIDSTMARQFPLYGRTLLIVFGLRMAAIFVTSTAKIAHDGRLFPHWFVIGSSLVAAVLFLTATLNVWLVLVFPFWVLVLCGVIWQRSSRDAATLLTGGSM